VQFAASNIPGFALLAAVQSSHPGVSGSGSIHPSGMLFRCWQRTGTVIAEAFCSLQIIFQKERQHKQVRIPEIATFIPAVAQASRADAYGRVIGGTAAHQAEHGETQSGLQFTV